MYKSMNIEQISMINGIENLSDINNMTMIYDPVTDEIILNTESRYYEIRCKLVESYLHANKEDRSKFKKEIQCFTEEISLLDEIIGKREIRKVEQEAREILKILGKQRMDPFEKVSGILKAFTLIDLSYFSTSGYDSFMYGYIQGIRAERARRKRGNA